MKNRHEIQKAFGLFGLIVISCVIRASEGADTSQDETYIEPNSEMAYFYASSSSPLQLNLNQGGEVRGLPQSFLQIGLSGDFAFGFSTADNEELSYLQGGGHDPHQNGFTVQNIEMSLTSSVDPYFDAQANIVYFLDSSGESQMELEEAYFTTRTLPLGMQVKAGQYFTEFGRLNRQHPHQWEFSDQPVVSTRFLGGDGLRGPGLQLSWLLPTNGYKELILGLQNSKGETAHSFLGAVGEEIAGFEFQDRQIRNFSDLLFSARGLLGLDASDTISVNWGFSALSGPNATGTDNSTEIFGTDFFLKWEAQQGTKGFPFLAWHSEFLYRRFEAGDSAEKTDLRDWGGFTQVSYGFHERWVLGGRLEAARGEDADSTDPFRDNRDRVAFNLTFYPTEFSKIRIQYNFDRVQFLSDTNQQSIWISSEFNIGNHMAHTF